MVYREQIEMTLSNSRGPGRRAKVEVDCRGRPRLSLDYQGPPTGPCNNTGMEPCPCSTLSKNAFHSLSGKGTAKR